MSRATSPSTHTFVRPPAGNGCAERFVRILKENLLWVKDFAIAEEWPQEQLHPLPLAA